MPLTLAGREPTVNTFAKSIRGQKITHFQVFFRIERTFQQLLLPALLPASFFKD